MPSVFPHRIIQIGRNRRREDRGPFVHADGFGIAETAEAFDACEFAVAGSSCAAKGELDDVVAI